MKMNQNKFTISTIVVLVLITSLFAIQVSALVSKYPNINVSMVNQEPDPVAPGSAFDVRFRIDNSGGGVANNVKVKLVTPFPISAYGTETLEKDIGTVTSSQEQDVGVVQKWRLYADPNAATGDNTIEFWYKVDTQPWVKAGDFQVSVRTRNAFLTISEVASNPKTITPGTNTNVMFTLQNQASNDLSDITLTLDLTDLPFTPIGSGNEKIVDLINKNSEKSISYDLFTDADTQSKVYKVPYSINYFDSSGEEFTREGIVGLIVDSKPQISVYAESSTITTAGSSGEVSIKIVNKGFSDIKFMDVKLESGQNYKLTSAPETYIGQIDSDDYETADYTIQTTKDAKDSINLQLDVNYQDSNGKIYTDKVSVPVKIYTKSELNQKSSSPVMIIIIIVVVAGVVYYFYKRRSSRRK